MDAKIGRATYLGLDVGHDTTLRDDNMSEELVQLFVVADGELQVTGDDTLLLVVARGIASEFENFGSQVLEDCGEVDCDACQR